MLGKFFRDFLGISILSPKNINLNFFWISDYTDYTVYIWLYCGLWHVDADYFFCVYSSYSKEYVFILYLWINSSLSGLLSYEIGLIHIILQESHHLRIPLFLLVVTPMMQWLLFSIS